MANICSNVFYAYSNDYNNIKHITKFFEKWDCYGNAKIANYEESIAVDIKYK